jgi:hypothetical protein
MSYIQSLNFAELIIRSEGMASGRRVIRVEDIEKFFDIKSRAAYARMSDIRIYFEKKKHQPITINCFCEYYDVEEQEFLLVIKP